LLFNFESVVQARTIADDRPLGIVDNFGKPLTSLALFTPLEGTVLTVDKDRLQLWQLGAPNVHPRLVRTYHGHSGQSQSAITAVDFSADGAFFVSAGEDQTVRVWRLPGRKEIDSERKVGVVTAISGQAEGGGGTVTLIAEIDNKDDKLLPGTLSTMVVFPTRPAETRAAGN
jgi:WD40 repeat protein